MARFTVLLFPDEKAGGFTVEVPALPGVVTEGDTQEEAIANARDAIALMLEDMKADGESIPEERVVPELATVEVAVLNETPPALAGRSNPV
jgi:antitoxin HicB